MYRIVEVQGIPLTKGLAQAHAALPGLPGEREIKPSRMKWVQGLIDNGRFAGPSWARGRCLADGVMYRFEGQHSSTKLAELDEVPQGLLVQMTTWEFDTLAESADLFNIFNNPRSARSNEDVMGVYKADVPELGHLTRKFLAKVGNAVHVRESEKWDNGDESALGPFTPREHGLYFRFPQPVAAARWLAQFQGARHAAFLSQPVIVAEMIREWEIDPVAATEFWQMVFEESHPDNHHYTRVLAFTFQQSINKRRERAPQYKAKAVKAFKEFQKEPPAATSEPLPFAPVEPTPPSTTV